MASAHQSATEYLRNARKDLVTRMKNLPLIIENLYQKKVFNHDEVDALKAERTEFDQARCVLDWVVNKGDEASYEFLQILDVTKKRTLDPGLHFWISCSPFRDEDAEPSCLFGTKPCQIYQTQLRVKAKSILKDQSKYLGDKVQGNFSFTPLVIKTDSVIHTQYKIKLKNKKFKKLRPKKLRVYNPNEGQALSPEDLLRWPDKNILIIGKPGVGKTSVVQEMLRLWAEKGGRQIDYMFYFDQSVLAHSSVASLESLLFEVYSKPIEEDKKDIFQDIEENSENVVVVFDGVTIFEEKSILWKIMTHELLPDAKIVITCRSEQEDDPLFSDWPTRTVYVQGFSEESVRTYYQKMLGRDPVLLEAVLKNQELFSLSHVPMYASLIVDFIKFKNVTECNHHHTVTEIYIHIFRLAVKKHGNKQNKQIDKYLKEKKDQIHRLMENAFDGTMQKCLNLPDFSSDEADICHAFLKIITTTDSPTSATTHCAFLHNTMQEFFSGLWLLGHPDEIEKVLQLCQTEEHKHMRHVLPFLCGLLSEHNTRLLKCLFPEDQIQKTSDWLIEKLVDTLLQPQSEEFDLLYVCQCLYELQSPKACFMFLEKMNHQIEPEVDLDPHQSCALSYVIGQSRDKEVYLNLDDCDVTDVGMIMLLSCSPNIRLKTCKELLKQITFFVEFFHKTSHCECKLLEVRGRYNSEKCNALLDLCSHVKNYETQTGRSFLPALQSFFQLPDDVRFIDLSKRKSSVLLEVLKLQTEKKPVKLICSEEESDVKSFLQCLQHISELSFSNLSESRFFLSLFMKAAEIETQTGEQMLEQLASVCSPGYGWTDIFYDYDFLLDLCSRVKKYETQTGRSFLPGLQSVFQSPDEWIIDLSERKSSVLLEVLKLQTEKKPVKLRRCSEEERDVMSFLQCLKHISRLRFWFSDNKEARMSGVIFLLKLCVAAVETDRDTGTRFSSLLSSVCSYKTFPFDKERDGYDAEVQSDFLLDLCSRVKNYETQTGRSFLPALQSVFQSPDVWIIDLSKRRISVLLEVLKLQTEKKPVELMGCSEEERDLMSFLQCLQHISQLRFWNISNKEARMSGVIFLLKLCVAAVETDRDTGTRFSSLLSSVCSYKTFPFDEESAYQSDFLLDLFSRVKNYETQTGRSFLPALQSVFQSPDVWILDLSERKISVLLEVLKLQTEKKPVELMGCSEEERDLMSFLQCLQHISQLRFWNISNKEARMSGVIFLLKLCVAAVETDRYTGTRFSSLLSSVCSYKTFPFDKESAYQSDFLLDLFSLVKNYETQTGRSFLPALHSVFQSPDVWIIDLSERKISVLLEVLKLQTEKKPVKLRRCSEEERDVMSFLQCVQHISQLRFWNISNKEARMSGVIFLLKLCVAAVETDRDTGTRFSSLLSSVCSYKTFPFDKDIYHHFHHYQSDFLLDLFSLVKNYETQTGRSFLPALQSVFQSPDVWIIDLSERKISVLLEVLKLQTEKKTVELMGCSEEERDLMSFLQCLQHISQLRFWFSDDEEARMSGVRFLLKLCVAAVETDRYTGTRFSSLLSSVCSYKTFPFDKESAYQSDFLLDLFSRVKNYETQTGRSFLPALQSVFQSPDVWIIDLSERKISVLLEVLKLQTEKKPVKLRRCSEEERDVMSFLQCVQHISQLRFWFSDDEEARMSGVRFLLKLCVAAVETDRDTGTRFSSLLSSVCSYKTFPFDKERDGYDAEVQSDFLLDLCSRVKNYETQTGRSFLPALQSVFQSPDVWIIDLSERKISVLLEVLKLQTEKKPVELMGCSEEERDLMSFLQCLQHISQLRFWNISNKEARMSGVIFLLKLCVAAVETDRDTGTRFSSLLSSVCSYKTFPFDKESAYQSDFLLDLFSRVKNYETQTGRSFLPALQSVFQSPDVWIIDLSERKISVLLEVLKLQTEKKPVELRRCSEEERDLMSFLQCLQHISQLRFWFSDDEEARMSGVRFLLKLCVAAVETDRDTGTRFSSLLSSVCSYKTFPFDEESAYQSDFLLDLFSRVKNYETQTGRSFLPALQSVFQSPDVWIIDLSERKISVLLEVLKLQTEKKPVELRRCSEEERDVMSFLQCLQHISQLRFWNISNKEARMSGVIFLLNLCVAAVETDRDTGTRFSSLLSSVCSYKTFPFDKEIGDYDAEVQSDFLLDLCSRVKNYETQTGRSFLPALQSVFQSPDVWIIDLSERKISVLLEVLKLQTEKKPVELMGCSEEERDLMSFLQCLQHISQLRFWNISNKEARMSGVIFLLNLCVAAVETDRDTGTRFSSLLSSVCSYKTFPFDKEIGDYDDEVQSDFLLDLCSLVKNYETQTGRSFLPALQSVFQSPDVWILDLSKRRISVLLEVLKLQTEKKPVELRRCSEEERDLMSFLQCLQHISQLRFWFSDNKEARMSGVIFLLKLCVAAVETDRDTGTRFSSLLSSVCSYKTFPFDKERDGYDAEVQSDFLLDLCSCVKNNETQTGRSFLPALQSVFQSPDEWIIDLSERKSSVLLEVLKLQTEKKPVKLRRCSEEERDVMSFLQCLKHISRLRFWFIDKEARMSGVRFLLNLCVAAVETDRDTGPRFSSLLSSVCSYKTFPFDEESDDQRDFLLDLFSLVKNYETQTGRSFLPALQSVFQSPDVWIIDLSERKISVLLEVLKLQTEKKPVKLRRCSEEERDVMSFLQCLKHISQLRLSKETAQKLVECVYEAQEEELTRCFLQKVDGDLTSCSLSWEELHYFLQHSIQRITLNLRKSNIQCRISEILPFLNRIQFKRMSSSFMLCVIREVYESGSAGFVSSLLSSVENYINLQSRDLDSVHCAALRFTLQHCTAASLSLQWTSVPEEELQSILPLFTHLSHLSVDRLLLLKMLHCCSVSDVQQETAAVLLSVLQHKLDFSCRSALDLTTNTDSEPLHLTADDCHVTSRVIQRAHSDTKTRLILQDCEIHTAGMDQLFPVLHSVQLCCDKPLLLQFLAHVRPEEAPSLSQALGEELDLSQTQLDPQVCRGLELILEYSEGLTELDLSQCRLTDHSLDLLLPNLHKAQIIDFSGNIITDAGAERIYRIVTHNSNIKTVRLFSNRIESRELFCSDSRFEIW
ncbi:uncharacterized protein LOC113107869 isoform X2 [Carassius auratus]|uniref:Uncharacterized protein LOC113107869 isoform X2 n=1 Tax=Carassius auratus TaxID=7957 RepID=A0A6P6PZ39_CARAU|nr:uncharacterized protein LOC113107869 isoform X2 [Carassius auratus]